MSQRVRLIYILKPVGFEGPYKIGCSYAPVTRLDAFLHWSPIPLEVVTSFPGSLMLESNIHDCLAASHSHKEWFHGTDKVRAFVAAMVAGAAVEVALDLRAREGRVRSKGTPTQPPSRRAYTKWHMRCRGAQVRAERERGTWFGRPADVEAELEVLRNARGDIPAHFNVRVVERFISDPTTYGIDSGRPRAPWARPKSADIPRPAQASVAEVA